MSNKRVIEMNGQEIEELMFHASRGANDQLFNGLAKRFLLQMEDEIRSIHEQLEKLERLIEMLIESKSKVEPKQEKKEDLPQNFKELKELYEKIDKQTIEKVLEGAMKVSIPMPKVELPKMKGADEK
ncbi:hypothetical protein ABEO92_13250 [Geobacillus stearothermophilus]|uniref:hypothetical protein n=1 Tax=Geobacillus stearothermophilus TaxID=1422 RepID=UPI003D20053F